MSKTKRMLCLIAVFLLFMMTAASAAPSVVAGPDSSGFPSITVESYTANGVTTYYTGGSIPVGAVIQFRVWVDLYNVDPVRIAYADGSSDSYSFDGAFSHDFYHAYAKAGVYVPEAYMPTDSGTFTGFPSEPISVGESGSSGYAGVPTVTGIGPLDALINGVVIILSGIGGVLGLSGSSATAVGMVVVVVVFCGFITLTGRARARGAGSGIRKSAYRDDAVDVGGGSTPQLLRSPDADDSQARGTELECKNLKAVWEDDKKKADFAKGLESAARARFARDVQHLPQDILEKCKEYIKDKAKDQVQELTEDAITAFFVAVPEVEVLTHVFVEVSKYLTKDNEGEPGLFEKLVNDYSSVVNTHSEAARLAELADFRFNEYKLRCL
jgi:hypothetical protein